MAKFPTMIFCLFFLPLLRLQPCRRTMMLPLPRTDRYRELATIPDDFHHCNANPTPRRPLHSWRFQLIPTKSRDLVSSSCQAKPPAALPSRRRFAVVRVHDSIWLLLVPNTLLAKSPHQHPLFTMNCSPPAPIFYTLSLILQGLRSWSAKVSRKATTHSLFLNQAASHCEYHCHCELSSNSNLKTWSSK